MSYVLIIGAKSDIAKAVAKIYAQNGYNLYLAAREVNELESFAKDLNIRTEQTVKLLEFDILDYHKHEDFYAQIEEKPEGLISAVGYLGEQKKAESDFSEMKKTIDTNYTSIVSFFNIVANDFERRGNGFLVAISSVAGDRGRKSNYIYGSAKAALTAYLSGLNNRLHHVGVTVLTVKAGFVNTKMTEGMDLPKKLTAQPEEVAKDIFNAQQKGKSIIYTKGIWRWIMFIIKMIPEWKFKGMSI